MAFLIQAASCVIAFFLLKLVDLVYPTHGDVRVLLTIFLVWFAACLIAWGGDVYRSRTVVVEKR